MVATREVKFGALFDRLTDKSPWLATGMHVCVHRPCMILKTRYLGHYADRRWRLPALSFSNLFAYSKFSARPQLCRPLDRSKDQTYYLSAIPESSLARALFPLAPYKKTEVRQMAHKWGLPTASRDESMGICFVGEKRRFADFICTPT